MAYQTKYLIEFADYLKLQWKIEFLTDPWAGAVTYLTATGDPLHIEFLSDSDEFNDPIRPSKAIINVYSLTDFALLDFYSDQDFRIKCNIYCGANIYWTGFVITGEYQEPYDCVPYPVKITCIDGLNYLKNILYDDGATPPVYYNGRTLESQIIIDILAKIQIVDFIEYVNIYEAAMHTAGTDTVDDSPLDQIRIDVDIFQDMYCYEVLAELLKKYNAVIRQVEGYIVIYRPTELTGVYVYGRIFTAAITKTSTYFQPAQQISRVAVVTNLKQFPGSVLMTKPPVKKITLSQDYGYKESWITNWEAKLNTYNKITESYEGWTNGGGGIGDAIYQLVNKFAGQEVGFAMVSNSGVIGSRFYIKQIFGSNALSSSDVFIFSFDYLHYNKTAADITVSIIIEIESNGSSNYLHIISDTAADWDASVNYVTFDSVATVGKSGWASFSREVMGLPYNGPYTITIYEPTGPTGDVGTLIKNIKFYSTSDEIIGLATYGGIYVKPKKSWVTQNPMRPSPIMISTVQMPSTSIIINKVATIVLREYTITNAINGKEIDFNYLLGDVADSNIDNVIEQFAGSLVTWVSSAAAFSSVWNTRSPGGEADPLLEITGGEIGNQYSRPKQLIQFALKETDATDTVLNIIGNVQDSMNKVGGVNRKFAFNAGEFSVKERLWSADLLEII